MLEQYLGPEVFRDGVRKYLTAHQFSNAETTDLWKALESASGQPIPEMMDGWIFRQGFPLVTVEVEGAGETVRFRQRPFRYLADGGDPTSTWLVPITYRARVRGEIVHGRLLLSAGDGRVDFPGKPDWLVANEGGHGFYRVQYEQTLLAPLLHAPTETLAPIERFNLVSDAWAATVAGTQPATDFLDLTARFRRETDRHVWASLVASFGYLSRIVSTDLRPGLEALVRDRLREATRRLGWSSRGEESELQRELRGELLRAMGTLGNDPGVQREARERYAREGTAETSDPNVYAAVIAIMAYAGDETEYQDFLARFKAAATPQGEQRYLRALAGFRTPALIRRTLQLCLCGEVRTQDAPFVVRDLLLSVHGRELAWAFVRDHWEEMERLYPSQSGLRRLCEGIVGLATPALEAEVRSFFAAKTVSFGGKTLEQYLEQLQVAVRFRERETASLRALLVRI
jgi:puromycin-sensitive aminopeptidase